MKRSIPLALFLAAFVAPEIHVSAEQIFFDDFADGDLRNDVPLDRDGQPVTWTAASGGTQLTAESGDLVVRTSSDSTPIAFMDSSFSGDVSMRSQVRLITDGLIGFAARGHWALLNTNGNASIGVLGSSAGLDVVTSSFNPMAEDLLMQFDAIGDSYALWVWRPHQAMPDDPILRVTDGPTGDNRIGVGGVTAAFPDASQFEAAFRFVRVSDTHIPEPSPIVIACICLLCTLKTVRRSSRQ